MATFWNTLNVDLWPNTTQGTSSLLLKKIEIFALSNRRFNKRSNDTKLLKKLIVILLKVQLLQNVYFLLFSLYFTHYLVQISQKKRPTRCTFCCNGSHIGSNINGFTNLIIQQKLHGTFLDYPEYVYWFPNGLPMAISMTDFWMISSPILYAISITHNACIKWIIKLALFLYQTWLWISKCE